MYRFNRIGLKLSTFYSDNLILIEQIQRYSVRKSYTNLNKSKIHYIRRGLLFKIPKSEEP